MLFVRHTGRGQELATTLSSQLISCGLKRGVGYPFVFVHRSPDIITLVHGDDSVSAGDDKDLEWPCMQLEASYDIQTQLLGMCNGYERQGTVLNRQICCGERGWRLEADPRHAELIVEQLGVGDCRSMASPGVDESEEVDYEQDVDIVGDDATRFRGACSALQLSCLRSSGYSIRDEGHMPRDAEAYHRGPQAIAETWKIP